MIFLAHFMLEEASGFNSGCLALFSGISCTSNSRFVFWVVVSKNMNVEMEIHYFGVVEKRHCVVEREASVQCQGRMSFGCVANFLETS